MQTQIPYDESLIEGGRIRAPHPGRPRRAANDPNRIEAAGSRRRDMSERQGRMFSRSARRLRWVGCQPSASRVWRLEEG
jgi:hypothetical protein